MNRRLPVGAFGRLLARCLWPALASVSLGLASAVAYAATLSGNPDNYRALLGQLKAGDELVLAGGSYLRGLPLHGVHGSAEQPIVIRGPLEGLPAVFVARAGANTVSIANASHVHIGHLVLDGRGVAVHAVVAEGGKACTQVHHITLHDLVIIGHGASQGINGISTKCIAWDWTIRRNVIVGAGTGLYLGNSDGSAPFFGGLIEQNLVLDSLGYNMQIKHQNERPTAPGVPAARLRTIIRHNVFSKAHQASTGVNARPNLLVGHFPRQGLGVDDVYEITHNVFHCNPVESLLQAEGNLSIARNVLVNPAGSAIAIQAHNDVPKSVSVAANFVAAAGRGVSIVKASPLHTQTVSDNWLFSPTPASGGVQQGNRVASFPAGEAQLNEWLGLKNGNGARAREFAPLVEFAQRVCQRSLSDAGGESASPGVTGSLSAHPACRLVDVLAGARGGETDRTQGICAP